MELNYCKSLLKIGIKIWWTYKQNNKICYLDVRA